MTIEPANPKAANKIEFAYVLDFRGELDNHLVYAIDTDDDGYADVILKLPKDDDLQVDRSITKIRVDVSMYRDKSEVEMEAMHAETEAERLDAKLAATERRQEAAKRRKAAQQKANEALDKLRSV